MLVPLEGYQQAWRQVKQDSVSHSTCRLVIFVSCMDVDAFAAARMLAVLMRKHLITIKIEPVVGYESLKKGLNRLDPSIRNVFLVGCGANIDLEEFIGGQQRPDLRVHVFDRNRPWNLNNLYGNDLIHCYDDSSADTLEPYREAYLYLATQQQEEVETGLGEASEGEEENGESPREEAGKRRKIDDSDSEKEDEGTQEDVVQLENTTDETQRQERKKQTAQSIRLLEQYYKQGSLITSTTAVSVYTLLTLIGETSSQLLWLAILGMTSVEAQHPQLYRLLLPSLQDEMHRLSDTQSTSQEGSATSIRHAHFSAEPDFSLFLLRQWSLYESMVHSSYTSAKLFLWSEEGRKKLHKLLARVGITLQEAQEPWMHTTPSLKRELKSKLDNISGLYGIEGIIRDGVVRQFGLTGSMSAGDCVESIAAYLEMGRAQRPVVSPPSQNLQSGYETESAKEDANDTEKESSDVDAASESWVLNFWTAWDAVDNHEWLTVGIEQAKELQRAVVATANYIFDKNLPKDLHSFRMVIVQDAPEIDVFLNPLSLQRLGVWICESCAEFHVSNIPFVLAILNEPENVFLVFGIAGNQDRDHLEGEDSGRQLINFFGRQFQDTAVQVKARIRVDAFDSSIIEVARTDLPRFLEALDFQIRK